ncbi:unnamed protein product [Dracunculus medinensis]|uniref:RRM domain-containing protein n=1 Tax=Dracunculus medinensis TaxID=318479 RepID=A0A0N4U567_DRAME|nr:unnamed protein product [Dracunculus medinensis]
MRIFYSSFLKLSFYLVSKEKIFFQLEKKAKVVKQSKNDAKIAAKQSKNDAKSVSQLGIKRKALDESAVTNLNKKAKVQKIFNLDILSEEQRRKEARDKCSLFVAGIPKKTKAQDLKSFFGWLIFADETHCDKAYDAISKQTLKGTPIKVDFCGVKSKMKKETQLPINPLELYISGFPPNTTKEQIFICIHFIFRFCFVTFANEADAKAAFDKGKSLKIGGQPVDVFYARIKKGD